MKLIEGTRTFFILCSDGETYYYTLNPTGEIYCKDFAKVYEANNKKIMPGAHSIDFCGHDFSLKTQSGETIYSFSEYHKATKKTSSSNDAGLPTIEMFYIDNDARSSLLALEKLSYDEAASQIPGLLYEPANQQGHTRKRVKI